MTAAPRAPHAPSRPRAPDEPDDTDRLLVSLPSLDGGWCLDVTASETHSLCAATLVLVSQKTGIRRRIAIAAVHLPAVAKALQEAAFLASHRWPAPKVHDGMPQRPRRPGVPR